MSICRLVGLTPVVIILAAIPPLRPARTIDPPSSFVSSFQTLRIEAVGLKPLQVEVSSVPLGLSIDSTGAGQLRSIVRVRTPAFIAVADSVRTLHVVVHGPAAVRLYFEGAAAAPKQAAPFWGRDITLVRRPDGTFWPTWRVQPVPD